MTVVGLGSRRRRVGAATSPRARTSSSRSSSSTRRWADRSTRTRRPPSSAPCSRRSRREAAAWARFARCSPCNPASAAAAGGRPTVPGAARAPAPQPVGADREEILPEPGFVVKTIDDAGRKIFINVCGHAKIQAPGTEWAGGKVPEHVEHALANLEDPDAVQQLRFPLSVSEGRGELDKAGQPCTAYDAVFNDDVVKQAMAHRKLKVFLVELCLQWVGQKYSLVLDPKYKLPHRRYVRRSPRAADDPRRSQEHDRGDR